MTKMKKITALICLIFTFSSLSFSRAYELLSPDGKLKATVKTEGGLSYNLASDGKIIVCDSPIGMTLSDGYSIGASKVISSIKGKIDNTISATFYRKAQIPDKCNTLTLEFKGSSVEFRMYDDGFAWRFGISDRPSCEITDETATYSFPEDCKSYVQYACRDEEWNNDQSLQMTDSDENIYKHINLSQWDKGRLAVSPLMVDCGDNLKLVIAESDTRHYPCEFIACEPGSHVLKGYFAAYPSVEEQGGHNNLQMLVTKRENYIARLDGSKRTFPWRMLLISRKDKDMADNDMVYRLAPAPEKDEDFSWVKPGKVAWDWWNDWNLRGVDFRAGINNETYKYYIDFAAAEGIEYVIMDEGWAVNLKADLFQVIPEIDIQMICEYAESKGVGIILWAGYWAFARDIENVCKHYSALGVKGFKVDFMNRSDQKIEDFLERSAQIAAKYHLVLDFHGIHRPTGLQRRYPNILNYEGVFGLEQLKFHENYDMVTFDVQIPFIRYVAGFADYTQGAMSNSTRKNFRMVYSEPQSQGTRCHQLAEYIVFDAPLNMLCDSPSNYIDNQECTNFIASVPTVWDETVVLDGEVGKYIVTARKKGDRWYIAALNNWDDRDIDIDISALKGAGSSFDAFVDGVNADRNARDYKHVTINTDAFGKVKVHLAPGGGFIMKNTCQ